MPGVDETKHIHTDLNHLISAVSLILCLSHNTRAVWMSPRPTVGLRVKCKERDFSAFGYQAEVSVFIVCVCVCAHASCWWSEGVKFLSLHPIKGAGVFTLDVECAPACVCVFGGGAIWAAARLETANNRLMKLYCLQTMIRKVPFLPSLPAAVHLHPCNDLIT